MSVIDTLTGRYAAHRTIRCHDCEGTGDYLVCYGVPCPTCKGKSYITIEDELVDLDDLDKEACAMSAIDGHTPGPWRVELGTTLIWGNCNPEDRSTFGMGYPVAEALGFRDWNKQNAPSEKERRANAILIAAAPMLPEVAKALRDFVSAWEQPAISVPRFENAAEQAAVILARYDAAIATDGDGDASTDPVARYDLWPGDESADYITIEDEQMPDFEERPFD